MILDIIVISMTIITTGYVMWKVGTPNELLLYIGMLGGLAIGTVTFGYIAEALLVTYVAKLIFTLFGMMAVMLLGADIAFYREFGLSDTLVVKHLNR